MRCHPRIYYFVKISAMRRSSRCCEPAMTMYEMMYAKATMPPNAISTVYSLSITYLEIDLEAVTEGDVVDGHAAQQQQREHRADGQC